jgi:hypothetical protein
MKLDKYLNESNQKIDTSELSPSTRKDVDLLGRAIYDSGIYSKGYDKIYDIINRVIKGVYKDGYEAGVDDEKRETYEKYDERGN